MTSMMDLETIDKQIKRLDEEISEMEDQINSMVKSADELDERVKELRAISQRKKENSYLWGAFVTVVSIVLAPFTGGGSILAALAVANINAQVNFDSSGDCEAASAKLREAVKNFRDKKAVLSTTRDQLKMKKNNLGSFFS